MSVSTQPWKPRTAEQRAIDKALEEKEKENRRQEIEEIRTLRESIKNAMKKLDDASNVLAGEDPTEISVAESSELVCIHAPIVISE
jgi:hypothetical protein